MGRTLFLEYHAEAFAGRWVESAILEIVHQNKHTQHTRNVYMYACLCLYLSNEEV